MDIEKIETFKLEPVPVQYGVDCLVCGNLIPMMHYPKICGECKYCDFLQEDGGDALYLPKDFFCAAGERKDSDG